MYYFDHAATSPMTMAAKDAYLETATTYFGNPSSIHQAGRQAKGLLEHCRWQVAEALGAPEGGVLFTAGGTQSNYLALALLIEALPRKKREVLISPLEHASIHHYLKSRKDIRLRQLSLVDGQVTPQSLAAAITPETGLLVLQHVNSVTGLVQPITALAAITKAREIYFHCDCVQSMGKLPLPQGVSSYSGAGHKFGGSKGCGILYLDPQLALPPLYPEVHQERGYQGGTEDLPGIVALTTALVESCQEQSRLLESYQQFRQVIKAQLPEWQMLEGVEQYPGICGLLAPRCSGEKVLVDLDQLGYAISVSSACNTHRQQDPALEGYGLSKEEGERFLRISFGPEHRREDIFKLCQELQKF